MSAIVGYHWLIPLLAAGANVTICILVLRLGMRERLHRGFAALTLTSTSWNLGIFSLCFFRDPVAAEWWSRVFRTAICLAPAVVYHFGLILSESESRRARALLVFGYAAGSALALLNLQGALVEGLAPHTWGWYLRTTPLYNALTALLVLFCVLWAERVWSAYRFASSARQRVQAKFWLLGAVIQIPFALTNLLPLYGFNTYPLGSVGSVAFAGLVAYAMVRHRLMDVDFVVRKGASFLLASAVVVVPGALALELLTEELSPEAAPILVCAAVALALVSIMLVPTLQQALETRVHRALFPARYDSRLRLRQLSAALVHILDQGELVRRLGETLTEVLDVESCHVFVRDDERSHLRLLYATPDWTPSLPEGAARALEVVHEPMLVSEVEALSASAAALLRTHAWEVAIPLRINDRLTGLVALGRDKDYRIFSAEDLQLLATVAAGASVALENASLSRQLRRSEVVLERANRLSSLGMLAAGIAHEIRNPLVAVKTFLDLLPQRLEDHEFLSHFRELSLGELRRVTDLIADLLALGKSKTAERRAVELGPTLEPVVRLMESTARKRHIEVAAAFDPRVPPAWADPDQLKQIIVNLLLNAIETSSAGGHVKLDVRPAPPGSVVLEVRDDGPGIPANQLESIFHPFFTTKETGTGLGLALVHQMVVEHGGEITVESTVGRGSAFRVVLPTAPLALARTGT